MHTHSELQEIGEKMLRLANDGKIAEAIEYIATARDHDEAEAMVTASLDIANCPEEIIEAGLERFFSAHPRNPSADHGYWVHALSHFSKKLWKRGGYGSWIKLFNGIAFRGANELGDSNCCDRLVRDCATYGQWDTVPIDLGYTEEALRYSRR